MPDNRTEYMVLSHHPDDPEIDGRIAWKEHGPTLAGNGDAAIAKHRAATDHESEWVATARWSPRMPEKELVERWSLKPSDEVRARAEEAQQKIEGT